MTLSCSLKDFTAAVRIGNHVVQQHGGWVNKISNLPPSLTLSVWASRVSQDSLVMG